MLFDPAKVMTSKTSEWGSLVGYITGFDCLFRKPRKVAAPYVHRPDTSPAAALLRPLASYLYRKASPVKAKPPPKPASPAKPATKAPRVRLVNP